MKLVFFKPQISMENVERMPLEKNTPGSFELPVTEVEIWDDRKID